MKSILVISEKYWPYGGAELATHLILGILKSANPRLRINVLTGCRNPEQVPEVNYVYCSHLDARTKIHLWMNLLVMSETGWFRRLITEADIVYVPRVAYPVIPLAKKFGKRVIVHLHDFQPINFQSMVLYPYSRKQTRHVFSDMKESLLLEILEHGGLRRAVASSVLSPVNSLYRCWFSQADQVVCVSEAQKRIILSEMPEISKKVTVVYNPLPAVPVVEKSFSKPPLILYTGGDLYTKGFYVLLQAAERLKRSSLRFALAGRYHNKIKARLIGRYNGMLTLLGYIPHDQLFWLYHKCHAYVFPSICEEPLPYGVMESMLAETIPIASRLGGIPEIVSGTYAEKTMFTPWNVEELVERLEEILSLSKAQLKDIGTSLRETVLQRFNREIIKDRLFELFMSI